MLQNTMNTNQIEQIKELLQKEITKLVETAVSQMTQKKTITMINSHEGYTWSFDYVPNYLPEHIEIDLHFEQILTNVGELIKYINNNEQNEMREYIENSTLDHLRLAMQLSEYVKNVQLKKNIIYCVNNRAKKLFPKVAHALNSFAGYDCFLEIRSIINELLLLNPDYIFSINMLTVEEFNEQQHLFKCAINKCVASDDLEKVGDVMKYFESFRGSFQIVKKDMLSCLGKDRQLFE
jgi:hypothetical protein